MASPAGFFYLCLNTVQVPKVRIHASALLSPTCWWLYLPMAMFITIFTSTVKLTCGLTWDLISERCLLNPQVVSVCLSPYHESRGL